MLVRLLESVKSSSDEWTRKNLERYSLKSKKAFIEGTTGVYGRSACRHSADRIIHNFLNFDNLWSAIAPQCKLHTCSCLCVRNCSESFVRIDTVDRVSQNSQADELRYEYENNTCRGDAVEKKKALQQRDQNFVLPTSPMCMSLMLKNIGKYSSVIGRTCRDSWLPSRHRTSSYPRAHTPSCRSRRHGIHSAYQRTSEMKKKGQSWKTEMNWKRTKMNNLHFHGTMHRYCEYILL